MFDQEFRVVHQNPGRPLRVLLVEDNDAHVRIIRRALKGDAFDVVAVPELCEVEPMMTKQAFDALILDLHLPDSWAQNTFDALPDCARKVPIIVVSSGKAELSELSNSGRPYAALLQKGQYDITTLPSIVAKAVYSDR